MVITSELDGQGRQIFISSLRELTFHETLDYCIDIIGGEIAVTEDNATISKMIEAFESMPNYQERCYHRFWSGYTRQSHEKYYMNPNNNHKVSNITWMENEPKPIKADETCPMFDTVSYASLNKACTYQKCPICKVPLMNKYMLRGVCTGETWLADIFYYLKQDKLFIGNIHTKIIWNSNRWEIQTLKENKTVAFMNETSDYPFGLNKWYFEAFVCKDEGEEYRRLLLHLQVEQPGKFCCEDGNCIDSELVCDQNQHCNDNTDENNCNLVETNKFYNKRTAPSERIKKWRDISFTKSKVVLNIFIYYVMEIDQDEASWTLLFSNTASWKDFRLHYKFLKTNMQNKVVLNQSDIWIPNIKYAITHSQETVSKNLYIQKEGKPTLSGGFNELHPQGK